MTNIPAEDKLILQTRIENMKGYPFAGITRADIRKFFEKYPLGQYQEFDTTSKVHKTYPAKETIVTNPWSDPNGLSEITMRMDPLITFAANQLFQMGRNKVSTWDIIYYLYNYAEELRRQGQKI